jgi:hypothetical protein
LSATPPPIVLYIIIAIVSALGGYLTRRVQKYEDRMDEVQLKVLPSLSFYLTSFLKAVELYQQGKNFNDFKIRIDDISTKLSEKIISGDAVLAEVNQDALIKFYWNLESLRMTLGQIYDPANPNRQQDTLTAFKEGNIKFSQWLKVDPKRLVEEADALTKEIKKKTRKYSIFSIAVIIMVILVAIVVGVSNYLSTLSESAE